MSDLDVASSPWYYGLAVLVLVIGLSIFAWSLFSGITGLTAGLIQIVAPGTSDLDLKEAGEYTVFYENQSYADGRFFSTGDNIPGLQIEVIEKSTGNKLSTYPPSGSLTYRMGSRFGRAILAFRVNSPGVYLLRASYPPGRVGSQVVLAVGRGFMEGILFTVAISLVAFFGSLIIAAALVITVHKRRHQVQERLREEERLIRGEKSFDRGRL
jgi:hypothetical protein